MVRGVIFDLDGTLFQSEYDWPAIRSRIGAVDPGRTILEHLQSLPPDERRRKERWLESVEDRATEDGRLMPGAAELLGFLRERQVKLALVTNNRRQNAERVVERFGLPFDAVLGRDHGPPKPSGELFRIAARKLGLNPAELAAVGDNELDLNAAAESGIGLVITVTRDAARFADRGDHVLRDLAEVQAVLAGAVAPAP